MFFVNKSHSKKDIINCFKNLEIDLDKNLTKHEIIELLESKIRDCKFNDYIKNPTELIEYLKKPTTRQKFNERKKQEIMCIAHKIIEWSKNKYSFKIYDDINQPYNDILSICQYGDISSVRRACKLYNMSPYCINNVNPIISKDLMIELNKRKYKKKESKIKFKFTKSTYIISF